MSQTSNVARCTVQFTNRSLRNTRHYRFGFMLKSTISTVLLKKVLLCVVSDNPTWKLLPKYKRKQVRDFHRFYSGSLEEPSQTRSHSRTGNRLNCVRCTNLRQPLSPPLYKGYSLLSKFLYEFARSISCKSYC